ncbi:uncharacterized protein BX664DRAFT_340427 [Halteromyces radiatus]|uniref:uncharacterized protein n=1 Tax=Halteromyces radiatus TaxID=101107 RepID=UPI002220D8FA|nr:uncharacterized protein BX664DRAFT_340427 [Halteromyces radiatus]KAI8081452.1 hypothetical protein BX664DRAFT_340427 [Halteromyces radiatus]
MMERTHLFGYGCLLCISNSLNSALSLSLLVPVFFWCVLLLLDDAVQLIGLYLSLGL